MGQCPSLVLLKSPPHKYKWRGYVPTATTWCEKVALARLQPLDKPVTTSPATSKELCTYPLSSPVSSIAQWSGATAGQPFSADWNMCKTIYALCVILNKLPRSNTEEMRSQLSLPPLASRRGATAILQVHRCLSRCAPVYLSTKFANKRLHPHQLLPSPHPLVELKIFILKHHVRIYTSPLLNTMEPTYVITFPMT